MTAQVKLTKKKLTDMARELGIKNAAKTRKDELIRTIQISQGHHGCFKHIPDCTVSPCLFRGECIG
ncbi:MAG: Rho termination factor N-terminal domain-containing protein [Mariprofundaceae bacterium]